MKTQMTGLIIVIFTALLTACNAKKSDSSDKGALVVTSKGVIITVTVPAAPVARYVDAITPTKVANPALQSILNVAMGPTPCGSDPACPQIALDDSSGLGLETDPTKKRTIVPAGATSVAFLITKEFLEHANIWNQLSSELVVETDPTKPSHSGDFEGILTTSTAAMSLDGAGPQEEKVPVVATTKLAK